MKNEQNIDFRATTTSRSSSVVEMSLRERFPLFQRGLGGFSSQSPEDFIGYNRYAYCRYNPFKYVDPSGESLMFSYDPGGNDISEKYLLYTSTYACDLVYNVLIWRNGKLSFGIGTEEELGIGALGGEDSQQTETQTDGTQGNGSTGGSSKDKDADKDNDENNDGDKPYKQKKLEKDKDGHYIIPDDATVANESNNGRPVYYKPESGEYDERFRVNEGYYITGGVDGIATSYSINKVYKMPDQMRVAVNDGVVSITNNGFDAFVLRGVIGVRITIGLFEGEIYRFHWLDTNYFIRINAFYGNGNWETLYRLNKR